MCGQHTKPAAPLVKSWWCSLCGEKEGSPHKPDCPRAAQVNFVQTETYEDGCQKSTWFNFHENGHQHVCVCGKYDPHVKAAKSSIETAREIISLYQRLFTESLRSDVPQLQTPSAMLRDAIATAITEGYKLGRDEHREEVRVALIPLIELLESIHPGKFSDALAALKEKE